MFYFRILRPFTAHHPERDESSPHPDIICHSRLLKLYVTNIYLKKIYVAGRIKDIVTKINFLEKLSLL
jgi:hypothetical protein